MKRYAFIINPVSGTRSKDKIEKEILSQANKRGVIVEIVRTEYAGHATELAHRFATEGYSLVVAVGGDGTVNEVAQGLIGFDTALAIVPTGSGNGLSNHLDFCRNVQKNLNYIFGASEIKSIDAGCMGDVPFFCTCGVGFDAYVGMKFAKYGKRGLLSYIKLTVGQYFRYKPETYTLEADETSFEGPALLITVANANQWGNNVKIAAGADISDGLFDITIVRPIKPWRLPVFAWHLLSGHIYKDSNVIHIKASTINISSNSPMIAHFDGEPLTASSNIEISMHRDALRTI
ncbi:MAG: diacylglycerol kinase family lipid kinase [Bacteroidales bacterium]|nr:diacylglycerol kinase family lipid kinase [Bacteroidales bacterium]